MIGGGKGVRCEISEGLILRFAHGACGRGTQSVKGLFEVEWSLVSVCSNKSDEEQIRARTATTRADYLRSMFPFGDATAL